MGKKLQNYLINAYLRKIKRNPNSMVFMPLANEYKNRGSLEDALRVVRDGLRNYPYYIGAMALSGELLFLSGELDEAESVLKTVAEKSPGHVLSRRLLLEIFQKLEKHREALQCTGELAKLCPSSSARYSEIGKELEKKMAFAGGDIKKQDVSEKSRLSNGAGSHCLKRLEQLYLGIKSETELRSKRGDALNDAPSVDWTAFQAVRVSDSCNLAGLQASGQSKEKQLEIFERMFLNIKSRVSRNI